MQYAAGQDHDSARIRAAIAAGADSRRFRTLCIPAVAGKSQPVYRLAKALCQRIHTEFKAFHRGHLT